MIVEIDGIRYVPYKPLPIDADEKDKALAAPMRYCMDFQDITVGDYLCKLLSTIWKEGDSFGGKRPFGNSGWEYDLIYSLIDCGYIPGSIALDEDGFVSNSQYDRDVADRLILQLIDYCFVRFV